jgi:outer membrane lipoprotein-sorting protein
VMKKSGAMLKLCVAACLFGTCASGKSFAYEQEGEGSPSAEEVLAGLEQRMSGVETLKAGFVQEKKLAVFEAPLVLKGSLFMQKPDLFAWHVKHPLKYSMVIEGEVLRQWDEDTGRVQQMSLSKNAAFKMVVRQMRDWFSGAYRSMLGEYNLRVVDLDPVSLEFTPRQGSLAQQVIESVHVVFESDERYIRQIHVVERGGDSTLLTFTDTLLNTPIDSSAWDAKQSVR